MIDLERAGRRYLSRNRAAQALGMTPVEQIGMRGAGPPVVPSHGWPLNSIRWEAQIPFLGSNGYRCIAHDHRGSS
jgi:pimeloyl-ACP methyl ester carboxylesterase